MQEAIFAHQAARLVTALAHQIDAGTKAGARYEDVWNRSLVEVQDLAVRDGVQAEASLTPYAPGRKRRAGLAMQIYNVSNAHCRLILVRNFHAGVNGLRTSQPALYPVLKRLADLFGLYWVEQVRVARLRSRRELGAAG